MSSYFDKIDREVKTVASFCAKDDAAFLAGLKEIEARLKQDVTVFAEDRETPPDLKIMLTRALEDFGVENKESAEFDLACRTSRLSREMHSIWHSIAEMRLTNRRGAINDNPGFMAAFIKSSNATEKMQILPTDPQEFRKWLERYDWFYYMSDDNGVWSAGDALEIRLREFLKGASDELKAIYNYEHSKHYNNNAFHSREPYKKPFDVPGEIAPFVEKR